MQSYQVHVILTMSVLYVNKRLYLTVFELLAKSYFKLNLDLNERPQRYLKTFGVLSFLV